MTASRPSGAHTRLVARVAVLGLVAGALVGGTTGARAARVVLDPAPVRVAVVTPDLAALVAAGVAPDLGDVTAQFTQLTDEINREGRAGRFRLETAVRLLSSQPSPEEVQTVCEWATLEVRALRPSSSPRCRTTVWHGVSPLSGRGSSSAMSASPNSSTPTRAGSS